jgi:hypothetical protein
MDNKITNQNDKGYVLLTVMLLLVLLSVIGIAAMNTSTVEMSIAANERRIFDDFYRSEAALFDQLERYPTWLTTSFLTSSWEDANATASVDFDADGANDAVVEIRCVEPTGTANPSLSASANDLPVDNHIGLPPPNSGYSIKYFEIRRYGLTSRSVSQSTELQAGAWKAFNKF